METGNTEAMAQRAENSRNLLNDVKKGGEVAEMSARICREYLDNVSATDELQAQILMGIKAGEDFYHLFLKAAKAVSLMTSNPQFYNQIKRDCRSIYGGILDKKEPLVEMLEETRQRMEKLEKAAATESDIDARDRITRCIDAHREKIRELEAQIEAAE